MAEPEVHLKFDGGTLLLAGPDAQQLAELPGCTFDPRSGSHRAEARYYRAIVEFLRRQLDDAATFDADAYDDARRTARRARQALRELLADGEVMLTPSAPGAAPAGLTSTGEPTFNRLWTLLGAPCVNVPGLADASGMPLGVQVIARFGRDRFALYAAAFLEQSIARLGA